MTKNIRPSAQEGIAQAQALTRDPDSLANSLNAAMAARREMETALVAAAGAIASAEAILARAKTMITTTVLQPTVVSNEASDNFCPGSAYGPLNAAAHRSAMQIARGMNREQFAESLVATGGAAVTLTIEPNSLLDRYLRGDVSDISQRAQAASALRLTGRDDLIWLYDR